MRKSEQLRRQAERKIQKAKELEKQEDVFIEAGQALFLAFQEGWPEEALKKIKKDLEKPFKSLVGH